VRPEEPHVFGLGEQPAGDELADEALIDRRLEFEIEVVKHLHRWKMRDLQRHRDARPLLRLDLLPEDRVEEIEVGRLDARASLSTASSRSATYRSAVASAAR
jgi:hypothetical protein